MAWAAGNFTRANGATEWQDDAALGIGIEPGMHDAQDNDLATGINNCLTKDGQNAPTADLPMGAFKHTNVANATARNHYAAVGQVQDGDYIWLGTTNGTATAMTATAAPQITAYKDGQKFRMKPNTASTGSSPTAHTLAVNGLTATSIIHQNGVNPTIGSWFTGSGRTLELVYNDSAFYIVSSPNYFDTWTPTLTPQNGTATGTTFSIAKYQRIGHNSCNITLRVTWTQNTAAANFIDITLPLRPTITLQGLSCIITTDASLRTGFAIISSSVGSGTVRCYDYDQGAILTGTKELILSGTYEIG